MKMTINDFLENIYPLAGWYIEIDGSIVDEECRSPLQHVAFCKGLSDISGDEAVLGLAIGISLLDADLISAASSGKKTGYCSKVEKTCYSELEWEMRGWLLTACGLKETA